MTTTPDLPALPGDFAYPEYPEPDGELEISIVGQRVPIDAFRCSSMHEWGMEVAESAFRRGIAWERTRTAPQAEPAALKGIGRINGDGWKDTTRIGEVVFVWNAAMLKPYSPGQYPRIGCGGWTVSVEQYDFTPATAEELRQAVEQIAEERDRFRAAASPLLVVAAGLEAAAPPAPAEPTVLPVSTHLDQIDAEQVAGEWLMAMVPTDRYRVFWQLERFSFDPHNGRCLVLRAHERIVAAAMCVRDSLNRTNLIRWTRRARMRCGRRTNRDRRRPHR